MASRSFLENLLLKLKTGNARSIHLNALPGRYNRLDLFDLINIDQGLHLKFIRQLTVKPRFNFPISMDFKKAGLDTAGTPTNTSTDNSSQLRLMMKKLDSLFYQQQDEFLEHGTNTFAFGYPLLIKRDIHKSGRILKAPVIIWYLDIKKDLHKSNSWIISKSDDHPVIFNELLRTHIESNDKVKLDSVLSAFEEEMIDETQIIKICKVLLEALGTTSTTFDSELKVLPGTNKESIEKLTGDDPWIRWSGIFGLYRTQKQSIIRDMETFIAQPELTQSPRITNPDDTGLPNFAAVDLDPSQETILNKLATNDKVIIQGPPGTGKSQSLTALITNSLYSGKTCLVVSEKKTALDVIYKNLVAIGLSEYCIIIEDVYRDRKKVVTKVRHLLDHRDDPHPEFRQVDYTEIERVFIERRKAFERELTASNEVCFGDDTMIALIARLRKSMMENETCEIHPEIPTGSLDLSYSAFLSYKQKIKEAVVLFEATDNFKSFDCIRDAFFENTSHGQPTTFPDVESMISAIDRMTGIHKEYIRDGSISFDRWTGFNKIKVRLLSFFSKRHKKIYTDWRSIITSYEKLTSDFKSANLFDHPFPIVKDTRTVSALIAASSALRPALNEMLANENSFPAYSAWRAFLIKSDDPLRAILTELAENVPCRCWKDSFEIWYVRQFIESRCKTFELSGNTSDALNELKIVDDQLRERLPNRIIRTWDEKQKDILKERTISGIKQLYNFRRNKAYGRRNSLRKIIHRDTELFATMFPVVLVNPTVCSSVMPLKKGLFDHVVFDEASQLRIEDTFPALFRGNKKVISGDKHQMPPPSYFMSNVMLLSENESIEDDLEQDSMSESPDEFLAESASLLEYCMDSDFLPVFLDFHYRSLHPGLIEFSNASFYGNRLVPMPDTSGEDPFNFFDVSGIYSKNRTNPEEALAISDYLFNQIQPENDVYPSVGIATFNLNQRNLIWDELLKRSYDDEAKSSKLGKLLDQGLFVKNLENIQGDERDIMLISTTYGPDEDGRFKQQFGPITRQNGYQLLNVIITRAKKKMAVFTSVPLNYRRDFAAALDERGNTGKGIFYAFLNYAEAMSAKDSNRIKQIIDIVDKHCQENPFSHELRSMPLFHQLIYGTLVDEFGSSQVAHNYGWGGFVLDMVILKNDLPVLALITTHDRIASDTSYRMMLFKKKILSERGIPMKIIDALRWFREWEAEEKLLFHDIRLALAGKNDHSTVLSQ